MNYPPAAAGVIRIRQTFKAKVGILYASTLSTLTILTPAGMVGAIKVIIFLNYSKLR